MIGQTVSHYRILELLGEGGMGVVYRAEDLKLDRVVALKFLASEFVRASDSKARFVHEAKAASALDHPNICTIHGIEETEDGRLFIAMACYQGKTLKDLIGRGPLEVEEAVEIAVQVAQGLAKAHSLGIVHRDIKPANVFLTEDGLVKLLDFGIAKLVGQTQVTRTGSVLGTMHYMSPEQLQGDEVDRRTDLWSLGVVLYEMLTGKLPFTGEQPQAVINAILNNEPAALGAQRQGLPPQLELAVQKCLLKRPAERYQGAEALLEVLQPLGGLGKSRLLQQRTAGQHTLADARGVQPYPGLSSFSEKEAEYFHGRESQVEAVWQKLRNSRLLAVAGPSGVGKTSFLRAGFMPARPKEWGVILATPGGSPFLSLREALVRELAGDTEAMLALLRENDLDTDVTMARRWRQGQAEALLILDQFEELFTLSPPEEQARFADLLSRLTFEADVHVLVSLRDDFLFHCREHAGLTPLFESLTVLLPLTGTGLHRALVQPALDCGYAFADETLVDEIMAAVEGERGALPLLAFAMSQLWERRDREQGLLTRQAYEQIGAVSGALVQHAEAVMEQIGSERHPVVRELFRNLVTALGTRAVRERKQLLSVFDTTDRSAAEEVLGQLIDARLLTSYEVKGEDGAVQRRIEIIHESLLSEWPRLVRWQSQEADNAQMRDQLRHAARLWEQKGQSDDLLWTGTAFQEFELWRERYPGGLSSSEESFARAMASRAAIRRRRRRIAYVSSLAALLVVLAVVGGLWRQARHEAQVSEARRYHMLAEDALDQDNTVALALATASLELEDNATVRRLALTALWKAPCRFVMTLPDTLPDSFRTCDLSPDGKWLATPGKGGVLLWPADGSEPRHLLRGETEVPYYTRGASFDSRGDHLYDRAIPVDDPEWKYPVLTTLWSLPEGLVQHVWEYGLEPMAEMVFPGGDPPRLLVAQRDDPDKPWRWFSHALDQDKSRLLGRADTSTDDTREFFVDPTGRYLLDWKDQEVFLFPLDSLETAPPLLVGWHEDNVMSVGIDPSGRLVASTDKSGGIRVWRIGQSGEPIFRHQHNIKISRFIVLDSAGTRLVVKAQGPPELAIYDLQQLGAEPQRLLPWGMMTSWTEFTPDGTWLVAPAKTLPEVWFYPQVKSFPTVWKFYPDSLLAPGKSQGGAPPPVAILPDGERIVAGGWPVLWTCDLFAEVKNCRPLFRHPTDRFLYPPAADTLGRYILSADFVKGRAWLIPLDGSTPRQLGGFVGHSFATALSEDARRAAVSGYSRDLDPPASLIRIWDLETDAVQELVPGHPERLQRLWFLPDNRLLTAAEVDLRIWDLTTGEFEVLSKRAYISPARLGWLPGALDTSKRFLVIQTREGIEFWDLMEHTKRDLPIASDGQMSLALASDARFVVAGMANGDVIYHSLGSDEVHLLLGHEEGVTVVHVLEGDEQIMSAGHDGTVRVWEIPQGRPVHTLPYTDLLDVLHDQTNLRIVGDVEAVEGYRIVYDHFPGWETAPSW